MLTKTLSDNISRIDNSLGRGRSFDIKLAHLRIGNIEAAYFFIDGYVASDSLQQVHIWLQNFNHDIVSIEAISEEAVAFSEQKQIREVDEIVKEILGGNVVFLFDGIDTALALNLYSFPKRSIEESEKNRTLRGPHDSFSESLLINTVLIRRRITSKKLIFEKYTFGSETNTRSALCYMNGIADKGVLNRIKEKLNSIKLTSMTLSQEAIVNALVKECKLKSSNPLPRVRYIERPDTAASILLEGKILIICDNSPSVIALPMTIFDFFEEQNDYYFPPFTGSYLKIVRFIIFILSVYLIPVWMLITSGKLLADTFGFLGVNDEYSVPLFLQFIILEIAIDGLKFASINTPSAMSNSLSVVGGLLLGDYAVKSGWFVPQTILYSAFTSIANFVPLNYELGYSFKFARILLILLVEFTGIWGLLGGTILFIILIAKTKTIDGSSYLYPLVPFDAHALKKVLIMTATGKEKN